MLQRFVGRTTDGRQSFFAMNAATMALRCAAAMLILEFGAGVAGAQMMSLPGKLDVTGTGASRYSVPIVVPPGTAGMAPALTLEYSSQGGNGLLGMGWSIGGLPSITRCPRTIVQDGIVGAVNYDANDQFCLDGQRLIAISGAYGGDGAEYRTEIETFSRIISHGVAGTGPAYFEVRTKSGQIMYFATTADARPLTQNSTARSWLLSTVQDTKGNYFWVQYTNDATNGQVYPVSISYTGNTPAGLVPYNSVQFVYETRPDIVPTYSAGSLTQTKVRLTNIKTFSGSTLVGNYVLTYEQAAGSLRSRLTSAKLCAGDGSCLPATSFAWTNGGVGAFTRYDLQVRNFANPPKALWSPIGGDFNGDGKSDLALITSVCVAGPPGTCTSSSTTIETYLSNGDRTFSNVEQVIPNVFLGTPPTTARYLVTGDFNADGKTDFLLVGQGAIITYLSNGNGTFTSSAQGISQPYPINYYYSFVGDFNMDGRTDFALVFGNTISRFTSDGNGGFARSDMVISANYAPLINMFWTTLSGDFNGDGRTDFVFAQGNTFQTYLSNADGTFTRVDQTLVDNIGTPSSNWTPIVGDFNGDGKSDICWIWAGTLLTYQGKGDGTFARVVQALPGYNFGVPITAYYAPMAGDFNGDGKTDVLLINSTDLYALLSNGNGNFTPTHTPVGSGTFFGTPPQATWMPLSGDYRGVGKTDASMLWTTYLISFESNGGATDLLASITTGLGATTAITYTPLTQSSVYTKDATATYPLQDLTGPIYVASRVDTSNGIAGTYSTTYRYAGAKGDITGRGFLGFRQMTKTDLQTNLVETTTFRQDFPYIGFVASKTKTLGAQTLNQTANTFQFSNASGAATVSTPSVASAPYRVSLSQNIESSTDLDGTAMPTVATSNQYDACGLHPGWVQQDHDQHLHQRRHQLVPGPAHRRHGHQHHTTMSTRSRAFI